ncbi:MAG: hypothetical protein QGI50_07635 [Dehalococcoidia bacterium]|nr:hypothetical protein [Dehalococcoidia bacterium]MDP7200820.1 hypothetical protein [Dehalococcoidia bacterium]HJN86939.1 hypothetical protein [Dehalococcoidia bacterium]
MYVVDPRPPESGRGLSCQWLPARRVSRAGLLLAVVGIFLLLLGGAGCSSDEVETAPGFSLPAADSREVALDQLLRENNTVVLVFYRGFF